MALVLKENKTWDDAFGNTYRNPYGVIDKCDGNKKSDIKIQKFMFEIYKNKDARDALKGALACYSYQVEGDDWDTYFSVAAIDADDNQYKKAYEYLMATGDWEDWEADPDEV